MAFEYQYGEDRLPISPQGELAPQELSNAYLQNLDQIMARQEAQQLERVQGTMENQGFFRSGDTLKNVSEQVIGPSVERRNAVLLPEMQRIAGQGREERLGQVQFDRQKELSKQDYLQRLDELDKQAAIKKMLMELESSLADPTGDIFSSILGQAAGSFAGAIGGRAGAGLFGGGSGTKASSGGGWPTPSY